MYLPTEYFVLLMIPISYLLCTKYKQIINILYILPINGMRITILICSLK